MSSGFDLYLESLRNWSLDRAHDYIYEHAQTLEYRGLSRCLDFRKRPKICAKQARFLFLVTSEVVVLIIDMMDVIDIVGERCEVLLQVS
jgi:hypothetical protein